MFAYVSKRLKNIFIYFNSLIYFLMLFNTFTFVIILFVMVSFDQTLLFLLGFRLEPIFDTATAASKDDFCFKVGYK